LSLAGGFFGGGVFLLIAALLYFHYRLARRSSPIVGSSPWAVPQIGVRNAAFRPARSVVAVATLASAAFILIAVNSFRKGAPESGAYSVVAESLVPIARDINSEEGREALFLNDLLPFTSNRFACVPAMTPAA
jgi:hypothetical protein